MAFGNLIITQTLAKLQSFNFQYIAMEVYKLYLARLLMLKVYQSFAIPKKA